MAPADHLGTLHLAPFGRIVEGALGFPRLAFDLAGSDEALLGSIVLPRCGPIAFALVGLPVGLILALLRGLVLMLFVHLDLLSCIPKRNLARSVPYAEA